MRLPAPLRAFFRAGFRPVPPGLERRAAPPAAQANPRPYLKARPRPRAFAVVIGNHDYRAPTPDVPYAGADADAVAAALPQLVGVPAARILPYKNLTAVQMQQLFGLAGRRDGQLHRLAAALRMDELIVYYSGHGVPEQRPGAAARGHLLPVDVSPAAPAYGGYPLDLLVAQLEALPVERVTLILDACFSGMSPAGALAPTSGAFGVAVEAPKARVSILSATAWDRPEQAFWNEPEGHGAFTWFLLEGLQGAADRAGNRDGALSLAELHAYVTEGVVLYTIRRGEGVSQTPSLSASDADAEWARLEE